MSFSRRREDGVNFGRVGMAGSQETLDLHSIGEEWG